MCGMCPGIDPGWGMMPGRWWLIGMWDTAGGGGWWCGGGLGEGWCDGFHPASSRAEEPPCSHAREPRPLIAQVDLARPRGLRVCKIKINLLIHQ
ncbi:RNase H domain-containing protein [Caerostris darwini]|uniref:RNase H domain-containing protein n=1 Tax=Caerostris darwini TaxID=1538125 RepID=A0AAV4SW02_9ARAC|nr:RNase H domain-containing protein [Caerostris darwini]